MNQIKKYLNSEFRCGGFYELCIQVSPTQDPEILIEYNNFFWSQAEVIGPLDNQYHSIPIDINNYTQEGILNLDTLQIPFKQFNIREESPATLGFNWFDISFYTSALENIFQLDPQHWTDQPKIPAVIESYLRNTMRNLFNLHPFQLAFIDFEISGLYYLSDLKNGFENYTNTRFHIDRKESPSIKDEYKDWITIIN